MHTAAIDRRPVPAAGNGRIGDEAHAFFFLLLLFVFYLINDDQGAVTATRPIADFSNCGFWSNK